MPSSCQGGFCSLVLPNINKNNIEGGDGTNNNNNSTNSSYTSSVFNKQHAKSLSKSEKRLKRSRQRDRVIQLLRWVLTDEEYSTLEESGDLVTLRVAHYDGDTHRNNNNDNGNNIQEGHWIDEDSIMLARREHRPELARLAFAEFQSSLGDDGLDMDGDCAAGLGSGERTNTVLEPLSCSCSSNDGNAIVCSICFNVYDLLRQARALLDASMQQRDDDDEEEAEDEACTDTVVNTEAVITTTHQQTDNEPSRKTVAADEGNSKKKKKDSNTKKEIIQSSTKPSHQTPRDEEQNQPKKKRKKRSRRRKRNRKQMEENSKVHVLVAEADEVRILSNVSFFTNANSSVSHS